MTNIFHAGYQAAMSDIASIITRGGTLAEVAEWVVNNSENANSTLNQARTALLLAETVQPASYARATAPSSDSLSSYEVGEPIELEHRPTASSLSRTTGRELEATVINDPTVPNWRPFRYTGPQSAPGYPVTRVSVSNGMRVWVRAYGSWRGGVVRAYKSRSNIPVEFRMANGGTKIRNFRPDDVRRPGEILLRVAPVGT